MIDFTWKFNWEEGVLSADGSGKAQGLVRWEGVGLEGHIETNGKLKMVRPNATKGRGGR